MSDNLRKYSLFPKTLSQVIEPLTRPVFKAKGLTNSRVLTEWKHIMGAELARHTYPEKISFPRGKKTGGTLTIAVENGFATEVQHMQAIILERLAVYSGHASITRIAINPAYLPAPKTAAPMRRASLSINSADIAADDEDLKHALQSLAKTLSGQTT